MIALAVAASAAPLEVTIEGTAITVRNTAEYAVGVTGVDLVDPRGWGVGRPSSRIEPGATATIHLTQVPPPPELPGAVLLRTMFGTTVLYPAGGPPPAARVDPALEAEVRRATAGCATRGRVELALAVGADGVPTDVWLRGTSLADGGEQCVVDGARKAHGASAGVYDVTRGYGAALVAAQDGPVVTFRNVGDEKVELTEVRLQDARDWTVSFAGPVALRPGEHVEVPVAGGSAPLPDVIGVTSAGLVAMTGEGIQALGALDPRRASSRPTCPTRSGAASRGCSASSCFPRRRAAGWSS